MRKTLMLQSLPNLSSCAEELNLQPSQAYVLVERQVMPQPSLTKAVDLCFKIVYVLDIEFQPNCKSAWQFLETVVYEFVNPHIQGSIRDIRAFINSKLT